MNRKQFLNRLGLGLGAAIVAPKLLTQEVKPAKDKMREVEYEPRLIATNYKVSKEYYDSLFPMEDIKTIEEADLRLLEMMYETVWGHVPNIS